MLAPPLRFVDRDHVIHDGRRLLYLGGIDYHRLSRHPLVGEAVAQAATELGLSATGSRLTTGNHPLYLELEERLADFLGCQATATSVSGYLSNTILLQAIAGEFDLFLVDEAAHSSLRDATRQFTTTTLTFRHLDQSSLEERLAAYLDDNAGHRARPLVLTDGVFPSRGEIAPLADYLSVVDDLDGRVLVDDAHAVGVLGGSGRGTWEQLSLPRDRLYQTGTLGKGFGVAGGLVAGGAALIEAIHDRSLAFVGSTPLAPPLAAGANRAVRYLAENPDLIRTLKERAEGLRVQLSSLGFALPDTAAPIFSITCGGESANQQLSRGLLAAGIYPSFINYPGAPSGGHFRFIVTSTTTDEQTALLIDAIRLAKP